MRKTLTYSQAVSASAPHSQVYSSYLINNELSLVQVLCKQSRKKTHLSFKNHSSLNIYRKHINRMRKENKTWKIIKYMTV